jgi:hypothetical protein
LRLNGINNSFILHSNDSKSADLIKNNTLVATNPRPKMAAKAVVALTFDRRLFTVSSHFQVLADRHSNRSGALNGKSGDALGRCHRCPRNGIQPDAESPTPAWKYQRRSGGHRSRVPFSTHRT